MKPVIKTDKIVLVPFSFKVAVPEAIGLQHPLPIIGVA